MAPHASQQEASRYSCEGARLPAAQTACQGPLAHGGWGCWRGKLLLCSQADPLQCCITREAWAKHDMMIAGSTGKRGSIAQVTLQVRRA